MRPERLRISGTMDLLHPPRCPPCRASSLLASVLAGAICASCTQTIASGAVTPATGSSAAIQPHGSRAAPAAATPLDRVVCNKRVVMLGEDGHHAGGGTLVVKTTLVSRLIDECGYTVVAFEANLAEFVDLSRALAVGKASPAHVADAIGGLWSVAGES